MKKHKKRKRKLIITALIENYSADKTLQDLCALTGANPGTLRVYLNKLKLPYRHIKRGPKVRFTAEEQAEKARQWFRACYAANPDYYRQRAIDYHRTHREERKAYARAYYQRKKQERMTDGV